MTVSELVMQLLCHIGRKRLTRNIYGIYLGVPLVFLVEAIFSRENLDLYISSTIQNTYTGLATNNDYPTPGPEKV